MKRVKLKCNCTICKINKRLADILNMRLEEDIIKNAPSNIPTSSMPSYLEGARKMLSQYTPKG